MVPGLCRLFIAIPLAVIAFTGCTFETCASQSRAANGGLQDVAKPGDEILSLLQSQLVSLGVNPTPDSVVVELSRGDDMYRKTICIMYLGRIGNVSQIEPIKGFIASPSRLVRIEAINSINLILSRETVNARRGYSPLFSQMIEAAANTYAEATSKLDSLDAAGLLCRLDDPSASSFVYNSLFAKDSLSAAYALNIVPCFIEYEKDSNTRLADWVKPLSSMALNMQVPFSRRVSAVLCLIRLDSEESNAVLQRVLSEDHDDRIHRLIEGKKGIESIPESEGRK